MHPNMIHKQILKVMLAALFSTATVSSIVAQVVPATSRGGAPLSVGGAFSYYDVDWAHSRMNGYTLWADARVPYLPHILEGLNIEGEFRDVAWNLGDKPSGYRQLTAGGGVVYEWHHFRNFSPYVKTEWSYGDIDFGQCLAQCGGPSPYTHDSRTVTAPGGGLEYRVFRGLWAKADYEYQFWPSLTGNTFLNPQGFTFGAMYDLRARSH